MLNFDCMRSFLSAMGYTKTPTVITFITCIFHYQWCFVFVEQLQMKIEGIAIATMITYFCNFAFTLIYVQLQIVVLKDETLKKSWILPDKNTFKDIKAYVKLATNCCLLLVLEWWCFEILALLSSYLGVL